MSKKRVKILLSIVLSIMSLSSLAHGQVLEFPTTSTTAKAGEYVLAPNVETDKITPNTNIMYSTWEMVAPGEKESTIKNSVTERTVPNALIIPIPAEQSVKVGDVVLTWWQSGAGMQRAIVVDAENPKEPVVRYLDIAYDNPVPNKAGVPIGQMDEQLQPNSFVKLTEAFASGTVVGVKDESRNRYNHHRVINVIGDKVILAGFLGRLSIRDKSECLPVPIIPEVKAGDEVYVNAVSSFIKATVKEVDKKIGRVFTEEGDAVAFGDLMNPMIRMIQSLLTQLGYKPGPIDGIMGKKTKAAITAFQKDMNVPEDGKPSMDLVRILYSKQP